MFIFLTEHELMIGAAGVALFIIVLVLIATRERN
jgi:hypothetical protein